MFKPYKIKKTDPKPMGDIMKLFIKKNGLTNGVNVQIVHAAWDKVTGAGPYTLSKFYKDGTLTVRLSSSVVRNQLYFQKDSLMEMINKELSEDPLFDQKDGLVKNIILK